MTRFLNGEGWFYSVPLFLYFLFPFLVMLEKLFRWWKIHPFILVMYTLNNFYHCHYQDLTSQVSAESDPVSLLPKVVSLLYVQVS